MHFFRFKGRGFISFFVLIAAILVFRFLFEDFLHDADGKLRAHVNGASLMVSGLVIFLIAARSDAKNGIDVRTKQTWTSDFFVSEHISFSMPMRLFGILLFLLSFFF